MSPYPPKRPATQSPLPCPSILQFLPRQDVAAWDTYVAPSKWDQVALPKVIAAAPTPFEAQSRAAVRIQAQTRGYLYRTHVWREAEYRKKLAAEKAIYRKAPPLEVPSTPASFCRVPSRLTVLPRMNAGKGPDELCDK